MHPAGFQHAALMAYLARHLATGVELFDKVLSDDGEDAAGQHSWSSTYLSLMDLPAEFILDTIRLAFHEFALARRQLLWRGERVERRRSPRPR